MRQINQEGIEIVKYFEGLRLTSYLCPAQVWTIGYGHTGKDVVRGMTITQAEAERLLSVDLYQFCMAVAKMLKVEVTDNQFSALVSFAFNLGSTALKNSTLMRKLNGGDYAGAANEFGKWVNAGGKKLDGLVRRRAAERKLFEK